MRLLETDRLHILPVTSEDAAFIFKLVNSPAWQEHIGERNVKSLEDAHRYIVNGPLRSYQQWGFGPYKVVLKNTNTAIGMCGLMKREVLEDVDLGFALLPSYIGYGYAYEAAMAVLQYAKGTLGMQRIIAVTSANNTPCLLLLQKLGLRFERTLCFYDQDALLLATDFT